MPAWAAPRACALCRPHAEHGPVPATLNLGGRARDPPLPHLEGGCRNPEQHPLFAAPSSSFTRRWHRQAPRIQGGPKRNGDGCGLSPPEVVGDPRGWGRGRMGLVEALVVGHPTVLGAQGTGVPGTPGVLVIGRTG